MEAKITKISPRKTARRIGVYSADALYAYLLEYKRSHDGNSPSIRDIKERFKISSSSMVVYLLRKLVETDKIRLAEYPKARSIEIIGGKWFPPTNNEAKK